jgi:wyosine [tRNA(Phe)-imidazoG37] synthetase (radical SAM superfamily)
MTPLEDHIKRLKLLDKHYLDNSKAIEEKLIKEFDKWLEKNLTRYERSQKMINIQIISKCNLNCSFCRGGMEQGIIKELTRTQTMSTKDFINIIDRCVEGNIRVIDLTPAIGEVMLDSDLFSKLDYLENNKNIDLFVLTTNLLKLTQKDIEKLSTYTKILYTISVYGYDAKTYHSNTNKNLFHLFLTNLKLFYNTIASLDFKGKVEFTMRSGVVYDNNFPNKEMYYILKALRHLGFVRINNNEIKDINRANNLLVSTEKSKKRSGVCIHGPGSGGGITQKGDFLFCPFNDITQKGVMGNIFTTPLNSILSGAKMTELIYKQTNNIYDGICESCNETW